jgi:hypothetical protein
MSYHPPASQIRTAKSPLTLLALLAVAASATAAAQTPAVGQTTAEALRAATLSASQIRSPLAAETSLK